MNFFLENHSGHVNNDSDSASFSYSLPAGILIHIPGIFIQNLSERPIHIARNPQAASPFVQTGPGRFALRKTEKEQWHTVGYDAAFEELARTAAETTGVVNAFGMFWDRIKVDWTSAQPKLLGQQPSSTAYVDFGNERGVYLLHDSQGVVYVGRATDQPLSKRLAQHTFDRLNGRWTRFSWFGVYPAEESGTLKTDADFSHVDINIVIATMEAVLIEGLEPRQNRKRGDDFQAVEFLQVEDPGFELKRKMAVAQELIAGLKK